MLVGAWSTVSYMPGCSSLCPSQRRRRSRNCVGQSLGERWQPGCPTTSPGTLARQWTWLSIHCTAISSVLYSSVVQWLPITDGIGSPTPTQVSILVATASFHSGVPQEISQHEGKSADWTSMWNTCMPTQQCATTVSIEATIIGSRYHLCLSRIDVVSIGHMSKVLGWMALLHYYSRIKKDTSRV